MCAHTCTPLGLPGALLWSLGQRPWKVDRAMSSGNRHLSVVGRGRRPAPGCSQQRPPAWLRLRLLRLLGSQGPVLEAGACEGEEDWVGGGCWPFAVLGMGLAMLVPVRGTGGDGGRAELN